MCYFAPLTQGLGKMVKRLKMLKGQRTGKGRRATEGENRQKTSHWNRIQVGDRVPNLRAPTSKGCWRGLHAPPSVTTIIYHYHQTCSEGGKVVSEENFYAQSETRINRRSHKIIYTEGFVSVQQVSKAFPIFFFSIEQVWTMLYPCRNDPSSPTSQLIAAAENIAKLVTHSGFGRLIQWTLAPAESQHQCTQRVPRQDHQAFAKTQHFWERPHVWTAPNSSLRGCLDH